MSQPDLMTAAIEKDSGDHLIWQVNRGLLSPLYLPEPRRLLTLPPGMPRWQVYELDLAPQETQNITVVFGFRTWILALIGSYNQAAGFKANFFDATKKRNIFGNTRELNVNVVGTASNPAWLPVPYEMAANSPLFIRVTNVATVEALGELVVYSHMEGE